jgi:CrcB protein
VSPVVVLAAIVAGGIGALARYGTTRAVEARYGVERLPRAVLVVNVAGSLVAGGVIGAAGSAEPGVTYVLVSGFTAGLTTFSTWSVETMQLAMRGRAGAAVRNVLVNLLAGGAAVWVGAAGAAGVVSLLAG